MGYLGTFQKCGPQISMKDIKREVKFFYYILVEMCLNVQREDITSLVAHTSKTPD
jgi:hypothetical protein